MSFPVCSRFSRLLVRLIVPAEASCRCSKQYTTNYRLCEVGSLEEPRDQTNVYQTGQLFLHKVLCYRGVILYPWMARLYDRDKATKTEVKGPINNKSVSNQEVKAQKHPYYEVLMDSRDSAFVNISHIIKDLPSATIFKVNQSAPTESVTFLGDIGHQRELFSIQGLDYVAHEDIVPYTSTERKPIDHDLFMKFLETDRLNAPAFTAKDEFTAWQKKHHPWLRLSDVYRATTDNIRVTVIPFYMGCRRTDLEQTYWWRYCVRLENFSDKAVQVVDKQLSVFSTSGTLDRLRVRSLIEQIPVLTKESPVYQYSSLVSLEASSGQIWGSYTMLKEDSTKFDCIIPPFGMEVSPEEKYGTEDDTV